MMKRIFDVDCFGESIPMWVDDEMSIGFVNDNDRDEAETESMVTGEIPECLYIFERWDEDWFEIIFDEILSKDVAMTVLFRLVRRELDNILLVMHDTKDGDDNVTQTLLEMYSKLVDVLDTVHDLVLCGSVGCNGRVVSELKEEVNSGFRTLERVFERIKRHINVSLEDGLRIVCSTMKQIATFHYEICFSCVMNSILDAGFYIYAGVHVFPHLFLYAEEENVDVYKEANTYREMEIKLILKDLLES